MAQSDVTVDSYKKTDMAQSRDMILDICRPLIQGFNANYVNYVKLFSDNTQIALTTHPEWVEHFFKQKFHHDVMCEEIQRKNRNHEVLLWDCYEENQRIRHDERQYFNFDHGITLVSRKP